MKISLEWISDFVDVSDIDPAEIADRLTLATAEVEGVESVERVVRGVFVGEVIACEPIDATSDEPTRLHAIQVDCGERGTFASVCAAPNVHKGLMSIFAPAGITLADGKTIRSGDMAGHASEGVLCSTAELGFSRWHEIVIELPTSMTRGTELAELVPARDVLIEVDNKSLTHRPDLWGQYGFARELAAIFSRELKPLGMIDLGRFDGLPEYPIQIDAPESCPCYSCIEFDAPGAVPSPLLLQSRLHALDQRTHNLLVDLTNYVLLELAQPTHAFDASRLKTVRVGPMGADGPFSTLDEQERPMLADDLMIYNEQGPVALAGVMGGLNSQVESTTTRVLLESANFKASKVRRTSVRLGLRTESSQRFEKSLPPIIVRWGTARILHLMEDAGVSVNAHTRWSVQGGLRQESRLIKLPPRFVQRKGGVDIPEERVTSILASLGFETTPADDGSLDVRVPPYRSERDLSIPIDIVEEVLRIHGYDNIEPSLPAAALKPAWVNEPVRREHKMRRLLTGAHGFLEVHSYGWFDDKWLAAIGFEPSATLALRNPSVEHKRRMRTTLLPNLLALVPGNRVHRDQFRLCEFGKVFHRTAENGCDETSRLAGVSHAASGTGSLEEHFRRIKGAIEEIGQTVSAEPFVFVETEPNASFPWQTAGGFVEICCDGKPVGTMGVLDGPLAETVGEGGQVVWFELTTDAIVGPIHPAVRHQPAPTYPGSWQDFSLVWEVSRGFGALEETLRRFDHPLVRRRSFLALYKGKGLPAGKGSYTFRFWLGLDDRTMTGEEIDGFREAFVGFLKGEGIELR